jgi:hypothetical protein
MTFTKYDSIITGIISGILIPLITGLIIFLFSADGLSLSSYLSQISETNIVTHSITLCVFPNVIIFLIYNRFDMLRACRGVLAITIVWAVVVFGVKILG